MTLSNLLTNSLKLVKSHSPEILTGLSVAGVATTSYLVGKASFKASEVIRDDILKEKEKLPQDSEGNISVRYFRTHKENIKLVWKMYIPPTVSGVATIACIIGASKSNSRRTTAAVTAYSLTERAFSEYREKVVEQIGKGKEQKIRDDINQDRINKNTVAKSEMVVLSGDRVLCCELYTKRYFRSDMESLRTAQNNINEKVLKEWYVSLDQFYDEIDLDHTSYSDKVGWDSDRLLLLEFSTVLSQDGQPCLAFEYNYLKPLK